MDLKVFHKNVVSFPMQITKCFVIECMDESYKEKDLLAHMLTNLILRLCFGCCL